MPKFQAFAKSAFLLLFLAALSVSCKKSVAFEKEKFHKKYPENCEINCPEILIELPVAQGGDIPSDSINQKVLATMKQIIYVGEKPFTSKNYDELSTAFLDSYRRMKEKDPEERFGWEAKVNGEVVYQTENLINIVLDHYTFTGGAHGYAGKHSLIFDAKTGHSVTNQTLFKNVKAFADYAERKFRTKFGIGQSEPLNSKGFMFENEEFILPETIIFDKNGLLLFYNPYEIASYAQGPQELLLPYSEVDTHLNLK